MAGLGEQVAVVTGSSRGLGRAIALELARQGAAVVINYNSGETEAREVASQVEQLGGRCTVIRANVAEAEQARGLISGAIGQFGRLDVLVNNAGITRDRTLRKLTDAEWLEVINNNLNSAYYCTSAAVPWMIEQKYGRIINISSFVGQAGNFGQANYAASKAGLIGFTKALALELARYNITVNAVAPGFLATDMVGEIPEQIQTQIKKRIPLGRFGEPEEVARAVVFLAAHGDYITGAQININGGVYM